MALMVAIAQRGLVAAFLALNKRLVVARFTCSLPKSRRQSKSQNVRQPNANLTWTRIRSRLNGRGCDVHLSLGSGLVGPGAKRSRRVVQTRFSLTTSLSYRTVRHTQHCIFPHDHPLEATLLLLPRYCWITPEMAIQIPDSKARNAFSTAKN